MPISQNEIFQNVDGQPVGTGLWVPDEKPVMAKTFVSTLTARLDEQDVKELLASPRRKPARVRFPGKRWTRNQGNRGSCNGYACAGAHGRARVCAGQPEVHMSGEFVYAGINGGRDQGSMLDDGNKFLKRVGGVSEEMVERLEYRWDRIPEQAKQEAKNNVVLENLEIREEFDLVQALALGHPGVVAVHFSSAMQRLDEDGVAGGGPGRGNHSVGVDDVRWNARKNRWEFDYFNSHGLQYGQDGKAWLYWARHFAGTIDYHAFFVILAAADHPSDDFRVPDKVLA